MFGRDVTKLPLYHNIGFGWSRLLEGKTFKSFLEVAKELSHDRPALDLEYGIMRDKYHSGPIPRRLYYGLAYEWFMYHYLAHFGWTMGIFNAYNVHSVQKTLHTKGLDATAHSHAHNNSYVAGIALDPAARISIHYDFDLEIGTVRELNGASRINNFYNEVYGTSHFHKFHTKSELSLIFTTGEYDITHRDFTPIMGTAYHRAMGYHDIEQKVANDPGFWSYLNLVASFGRRR